MFKPDPEGWTEAFLPQVNVAFSDFFGVVWPGSDRLSTMC